MLSSCDTCKRDYCTDCSKMHLCRCCGGRNCNDCYKNQWHKCDEKICFNCVEEHEKCYKCEECYGVFCSGCSDSSREYRTRLHTFVRNCVECHDRCCDDCRFRRFQLGQHNCAECIKTIVPLMMDEYRLLHQEVEQLKVENKELRSRN